MLELLNDCKTWDGSVAIAIATIQFLRNLLVYTARCDLSYYLERRSDFRFAQYKASFDQWNKLPALIYYAT